jgi:hypothetical protein
VVIHMVIIYLACLEARLEAMVSVEALRQACYCIVRENITNNAIASRAR